MNTGDKRPIAQVILLGIDSAIALSGLGLAVFLLWQSADSHLDRHGIVRISAILLIWVAAGFGLGAIGLYRRWKIQWLLQLLGPGLLAYFLFGPL